MTKRLTMKLTDRQLAARLRGIGASQELALMAIAEDGSCTEYLIEAASRLDAMHQTYPAAWMRGPDGDAQFMEGPGCPGPEWVPLFAPIRNIK